MSSRLFSLTCVQCDGRDPSEGHEGRAPGGGGGVQYPQTHVEVGHSPGKKRGADARHEGGGMKSVKFRRKKNVLVAMS